MADAKTTHELVPTGDGSLSVFDRQTGELYHNRAGAFSEALLNYVRPSGALTRLESSGNLILLDVCFGLGYNSFVLMQEALARGLAGKLIIHALEPDESILAALPRVLSYEKFNLLNKCFDAAEFHKAHRQSISANELQIELILDINTIETGLPAFNSAVDYVYHDPFSPAAMPELWTVEIFRQYNLLVRKRKGAVLTYSSASAVRGGLSEAGFLVAKTAPLGGKSGGTIGMIEANPEFEILQLNEQETEKMSGSGGVPYSDAGFSLNRQEILRARQLEQQRRGGRGGLRETASGYETLKDDCSMSS
jgi:tRNA U34 5-methylaminomethyl-2-thiouridine-forming methyltransferase MnmC